MFRQIRGKILTIPSVVNLPEWVSCDGARVTNWPGLVLARGARRQVSVIQTSPRSSTWAEPVGITSMRWSLWNNRHWRASSELGSPW